MSSTGPSVPSGPGGPRALTGRRTVVLLGLAGAGIVALGVSRPWGTVDVAALTSFGAIEIKGGQAAPAGAAVALAVGAAALVLSIAGRVVRFLIPFGMLVAGVALAVGGVSTIGDPDDAAADALRDTLSLGGSFLDSFDYTVSLNGWGWVYVAGAVVVALAGLLGVVGSRSWPVSGRRFERSPDAPGSAGRRPSDAAGWASSADVWDAQNRGEDLTSDPPSSGGSGHRGGGSTPEPVTTPTPHHSHSSSDSSPDSGSSDGGGGGDSGGGGGD